MSFQQLREIAEGFRAATPLGATPTPRTEPLRCPICSQPMTLEQIHRVTVDVCAAHGMWFDRRELALLERRIEAGERLAASQAVSAARREGKVSGWWFGLLSLFLDDD